MVVRIDEGFNSNSSLFQWARYMEYPRADMYEIGLWEEMVGLSGDDIVFAINIPQESVTIPETIDAIRAAMKMQPTGAEAVAATDGYLKIT
jgi:glyceraldehyde-3-phosphate dehydrogenase (NAD(P))